MPSRADLAYRQALTGVRLAVLERATTAAGKLDATALDDTWPAVSSAAVPAISAGQAAAARLAAGYLRGVVRATGARWEPGRLTVQPGTTDEGLTITEALAAIPAMLKQSAAGGTGLAELLAMAQHLVGRTGELEVARAADRVLRDQSARSPLTGWVGIVSARACARCRDANSGHHGLEARLYRHGRCSCSQAFATG